MHCRAKLLLHTAHGRLIRCCVFFLCASWLGAGAFSPAPVCAQPDSEAYRATIASALAEYDTGHYEEAFALFAHAHAEWPSARTLRGLSMAAFELRRYVECVTHADRALASTEQPLTGRLRAELADLRRRALLYTATLRVSVRPGDALVEVDGTEHPAAQPVLLALGEHAVEVRRPGFATQHRLVHVLSTEPRFLEVTLAPLGAPMLVGTPGQAADSADRLAAPRRRWYRSTALWTAVGLVVIAGAVTGGMLALRSDGTTRAPYAGNVGTTEGP